MSLILDTHRKYVSDQPRVAAFRRAIEDVVRPGDKVVDLGSGTGILGLLAARAGAAKVYSIEASGIIGLARQIAAENGYADRMEFIRGLSTRIDIPENVDVLLTDQIGRIGFEAGVFQFYKDGIRRFLKPGGRVLPSAMEFWIAPVSCPQVWDDCEFWHRPISGLSFHSAYPIANNTGYPLVFDPSQLLGAAKCAASANLYDADPDLWLGEASMEIEKEGVLHGLGGWFRAQLSPSVSMTNSPLAADRINRRNVFMPIGEALQVKPGDRVTARLRVVPSEVGLSWTVVVESGVQSGRPQIRRFAHSTMLGMLFSKEDLEKTDLNSVPRLTEWGVARRTVLQLIDGQRPLKAVELGVLQRHPNLFPALKDAAVFVAEVVSRYTL